MMHYGHTSGALRDNEPLYLLLYALALRMGLHYTIAAPLLTTYPTQLKRYNKKSWGIVREKGSLLYLSVLPFFRRLYVPDAIIFS